MLLVINKCQIEHWYRNLWILTGSGEVDLDALLEDLCIMEKDMNFDIETEAVFSETISSPKTNSPISPNTKVCCKFLVFWQQTLAFV